MKLSAKGVLVIALVLSLATAGLIYKYLQEATQKAPKDGVAVVVAKVDIPPKTKITAEMVSETKVPAEYVQPGAVHELTAAVGAIARDRILAGEQIAERRLVIQGKSAGFTGIIPPDKRAVTIAVTEVTGVAGFVKPGDYVDVVATFDQNTVGDNVSQIILQNVLVLAANRDAEAGAADGAKDKKDAVKTATVTLAVTPDEVAQLALAEDKGKVRLALRPYMPSAQVTLVNAVTPKDIVGAHTSPVQNVQSGETAPTPARPAPPAGQQPDDGGKGIQLIRGTKVETIPIQ
ncbi:Flp pilus assembly protein CpaB [Sporolituus thermophilus]|uniref:Pilus assembly protein CpaB n=1 Tax=Sporolituus thermophilus DSM 23256 TaxID=1123285 RepID=A0A1G7HNL5_9FIRM|nr:Flp pilus assembly protein CpaB [Sporolituus thermophilus]SDF02050.1 pilus assembly protein CpaB [Sporolituus thermophilus DSM 23256]